MTISINLMKAILSMDSYNRGYDAGIVFGNNPGTNNYSEDMPEIKIGNAEIYLSKGSLDAQTIGFYALAYEYNGETIISYRGTDDFDGIADYLTSKDAQAWLLGVGNYRVDQAIMALQFYNEVAGDPVDTRLANISFTGHSLGGGLVGYVATNDITIKK